MNRRTFFVVAVGVLLALALYLGLNPDEKKTERTVRGGTDIGVSSGSTPAGIAPKDVIGRRVTENREALRAAVSGRTFCQGRGIPRASVYAYLNDDKATHELFDRAYRDTPLVKVISDAEGRFVLELPRRPDPYRVDVGAVADGYVRCLVQAVVVSPGASTELDLELGEGLAITGRLIDSGGNALVGCPLLASNKAGMATVAGLLASPYSLDTSTLRLARHGSKYHESRCVTGERGEFRINGLVAGRYTVVSLRYEWIVSPASRCDAGAKDLLLVAKRAVGVSGSVVDSVTGEAITRCYVEVGDEAASYLRTGTSLGGQVRLAWIPEGEIGRVGATVKLTAKGHEPYHAKLVLGNGITDIGTIKLVPARTGRILLTVRYTDGTPFRNGLRLDYAESEGGTRGTVQLVKKAAGLYEGRAPAGDWYVRVWPSGWMGSRSTWRSEMSTAEHGTWHGAATLALGGKVRVKRPVSTHRWSLSALGRSFASNTALDQTESVFADFPVGRWTLIVLRDGKEMKRTEVEVQERGEYEIVVE